MHSLGSLGRLASILTICAVLQRSVAQQCYYPEGNASPDVPCNSNGSVSACCNEDAFCLGNGLCYLNAVISRGSCTDKSWLDPACPEPCSQWLTDRGAVLVNCNASSDAFICAGQSCDDQSSLFSMRDANSFVFNNSDNQLVTLNPGAKVNLASSASSVLPTATSSLISQIPSASLPASSSPSSSSSASSGAMYTAGDMAGVGVGIGIPLLLALLGALFVVRKQKKQLDALSAQGTSAPPPAPTPAPDYSKAAYDTHAPPGSYAQTPLMAGQQMATHPVAYSVPPQYHQEMDSAAGVNELSDHRERQELDATI